MGASAALRVLHVAHGWPPAQTAGAERYAAALHDAQARHGAVTDHFTPAHVPAAPAPPSRAVERAFRGRLQAFRPAVVHVHHLIGLSLALPRLARESGATVVMTMNDAWLACARGQLVDRDGAPCPGPAEARCARCLAPARRAWPLHLGKVRERATAVDDLRAALHALWTPSPHLAERFGWAHVPVAVPLLAPASPAPPNAPGPVRLLYVGSLLPTKGPDLALHAFAALPAGAATLTLVGPALPYNGSTGWADALLQRAHATPGVRVTGAVPPEALPAVYADHDVLLFPSRWPEMSPFVLREARAAGLRVVSADVPGARSVLTDATFVTGGEDAWDRAVAAEVRRGQARMPPVDLGSIDEHALDTLRRYHALRFGAAPPGTAR